MKRRLAMVLVTMGAVALLMAPAPSANAASGPSVSLQATPTIVTTGQATTFSGQVKPWKQGERVHILDPHGHVLASAITRAHGKFSAKYTPRANTWAYAEHRGVRSHAIQLKVRPLLSVSLTDVRLFGKASVRGTLRPWLAGKTVAIDLLDGTSVVGRANAKVGKEGVFAAKLAVPKPGAYRARVTFTDPDYLPAARVSTASATLLPSLSVGSTGTYVWLLEQRLVALHYRLTGEGDGRYDFRTADAVMAFRKVQGMDRVGSVDSATWEALASPRVPTPRTDTPADHVEVDQTRQVLYVVRGGSIAYILHVSTGKPSTPTHDGTFHVWLKEPGYNDKQMYYSSFFDGNRAIHGYASVPPYAASHGCVRIPIWAAIWMYGLDPVGTEVIVYH